MSNKLVIVGHPSFKESKFNKQMAAAVKEAGVKVHVLDEVYPNGEFDIAAEQAQMEQYDELIFQFPMHWFSAPWKMKKFFDDVFAYGWAYGPAAKLKDKKVKIAVSAGGAESSYKEGTSVEECLAWLTTTFKFCQVQSKVDIYAIYGAFTIDDAQLTAAIKGYVDFVKA